MYKDWTDINTKNLRTNIHETEKGKIPPTPGFELQVTPMSSQGHTHIRAFQVDFELHNKCGFPSLYPRYQFHGVRGRPLVLSNHYSLIIEGIVPIIW